MVIKNRGQGFQDSRVQVTGTAMATAYTRIASEQALCKVLKEVL